MDSVYETQRRAHEELERCEQAMADAFADAGSTVRWRLGRPPPLASLTPPPRGPSVQHVDRVNTEHFVKRMLDRSRARAEELAALYEDRDGARKAEWAATGPPNEFSEFYERLQALKDFHRRYPDEMLEPMELEFLRLRRAARLPVKSHAPDAASAVSAAGGGGAVDPAATPMASSAAAPGAIEPSVIAAEEMAKFTAEEAYGRNLDMHELHDEFMNLHRQFGERATKTSYLDYLGTFDRLFDVPMSSKRRADYRRYLQHLHAYLHGFIERTRPLFNVDAEMASAEEEFAQRWSEGTFPGWAIKHGSAPPPQPRPIAGVLLTVFAVAR